MGFGLGSLLGAGAAAIGVPFLGPTIGALGGGIMDAVSANQQNQAAIGRQNAAQDFSAGQAQIARDFSASQAKTQMDFQERMSNTAHQREVTDLKAAGLNPLLSANAGESSPGGAMGSSPSPTGSAAPVVPELGKLASSAVDSLRLYQDMKESNSRIASNIAGADQSTTGSYRNRASADLADSETWLNNQQRQLLDPEVSIARKHPYLYGWSKVLADRGIGASSALNAARTMGMLDLIP